MGEGVASEPVYEYRGPCAVLGAIVAIGLAVQRRVLRREIPPATWTSCLR